MIEAQHLRRSFSGHVAVSDVSFTARDGQITALLGPNGAGKTTSLRMLYGLLRPDAGSVRIDGLDTQHDPEAVRRRLGVLPDARGLYRRFTARENIEYFGRLHRLDEETLRGRTDALIDALDLGSIAGRRAEGFSQGERVKTAIARALVHDPQNLVLDEPTNGLDVMATRAMRRFLMDLRARGRCVVFSSHVMQEVTALADHIVVIAGGRVVADGSPDALRAITGMQQLEDAFVHLIGSDAGLAA